MSVCIAISVSLLAGGVLLWRELRRAPLLPPGRDADGQPLPEKLRAEEARQKPWEGRN